MKEFKFPYQAGTYFSHTLCKILTQRRKGRNGRGEQKK